jgi:hypothetical protein
MFFVVIFIRTNEFNCCCNISIYLTLFYNNVLIMLIFDFIKLYFNSSYNILYQSINCCDLFLIKYTNVKKKLGPNFQLGPGS